MTNEEEQDEVEELARARGIGTLADTQVRGRQGAPGVPCETHVDEAARDEEVGDAEGTGAGEPTLRRGQARVEAIVGGEVMEEVRQKRKDARLAAPGDEAARGFPLPPPASEEADDEHTDVQTGPIGMGFIPEEYGLGPGFTSVGGSSVPLPIGVKQNPLPGIAPMTVPAPKLAPIIKSVSVPVPTDSSYLSSQPVDSEQHLTPECVALTGSPTNLTKFIRLSRAQRWIALTVLLLAGGGVVLLSARGEKNRGSATSSQSMDLVLFADRDAATSPVAQAVIATDAQTTAMVVDPEPESEPESEPEPDPESVETPRRDAAKARNLRKRGRQLFKRGKHAAALRMYEGAVAADPIFPEIHRDIGQLHQRRGAWAQARSAYREYLKLAPKARDARKIRATLYRLRKR